MRRIKTVSNVPAGFPEYGITNASNFKRGLPQPTTPKRWEKGHLFNGMTPRLKAVSNLPLAFPEYRMIDASNLGGVFPLPATPKYWEKGGHVVMVRDRLVKMCSSCGEQIPLVLDKFLSQLIRFGWKLCRSEYHHTLSSLYLTRPRGRVEGSS